MINFQLLNFFDNLIFDFFFLWIIKILWSFFQNTKEFFRHLKLYLSMHQLSRLYIRKFSLGTSLALFVLATFDLKGVFHCVGVLGFWRALCAARCAAARYVASRYVDFMWHQCLLSLQRIHFHLKTTRIPVRITFKKLFAFPTRPYHHIILVFDIPYSESS